MDVELHKFNDISDAESTCAELNVMYALDIIKGDLPYFGGESLYLIEDDIYILKYCGYTNHIESFTASIDGTLCDKKIE